MAIGYYLKSAPGGEVKISIADAAGRTIRTLDGTRRAGINRVMWNLTAQPGQGGQPPAGFGARGGAAAVAAGTYIVTLDVGGKKLTKPVMVLEDVWMREER